MHISEKNWGQIRKFWGDSTYVTASPNMPYCVFATVNKDGSPRVAPYSSLILGENKQGFYFDHFAQHFTKNLDRDKKICVLLLKPANGFGLKRFYSGDLITHQV
jgi:predicted pyridoxine 5'-phosphate oxidase superfamily flavin-nucleotide-binding protein